MSIWKNPGDSRNFQKGSMPLASELHGIIPYRLKTQVHVYFNFFLGGGGGAKVRIWNEIAFTMRESCGVMGNDQLRQLQLFLAMAF